MTPGATQRTVHVDGQGIVQLRREDFVAAGGQGRVWAVGGTAIKIYDDPAAALTANKLAELARVDDPRVVVPGALARDPATDRVVGYAMRHVPDAWALAQLVPSAFWARHGVTVDDALRLAVDLAGALKAVHAAGLAVVDLNDTNVLVDPATYTPALIDADSWQTPNHRATAVTPAFADPRATSFGPDSDWFSYAVVAFALLVGIHPFKGRHRRVRGLADRMRAGISILDPAVRRPATCRPLDSIPPAWRAWFREVFAAGRRDPPPTIPRPATRPQRARSAPAHRLHVAGALGLTASLDATTGRISLAASRPVFPTTLPVPARAMAVVDDTVYVLGRACLFAVDPCRLGARIVVGLRPVADVMPHASRLWPGVVIQDILGVPHVTLLHRAGATTLPLPALAGRTVVDARFCGGWLEVQAREPDGSQTRGRWRCDPGPGGPRLVEADMSHGTAASAFDQ